MATAVGRTAFPTAPTARPRPVRRLLAASATASHASGTANLAQQLRQLKQFKVWDAPTANAGDRAQAHARGSRQPAPARQAAPVSGGAAPGAGSARRPGIVWFRGDLRLHDHQALTRAQAECSSLLPVYCFDPRDYGKSPQGYDKTGPYRAAFLAEAVADLRSALRAAGSELVVRVGRPEEVIGELVRRSGAGSVYCHSEVTYEELRVEAAVKAAAEAGGAKLQAFWANTLCHPEDLPFKLDHLPQNFDKFRERTEGALVRAALPAPQELRGMPLGGRVDPGEVPTLQQLGLQPLPPGCGSSGGGGDTTQPVGQRQAAASFPAMASGGGAAEAAGGSSSPRGGEGEALRQLRGFLAQAAASGSGGAAYGSNFAGSIAPWLATGCLSPRRMLEDAQAALQAAAGGAGASGAPAAAMQLEQQQQRRPQQDPLSWVRFELMWRDFFRFLTAKYSNTAPAATARSSSGALAGASA